MLQRVELWIERTAYLLMLDAAEGSRVLEVPMPSPQDCRSSITTRVWPASCDSPLSCRLRVDYGQGALPSAIVILEFPSMAQAKAWYNDPAYAPLIKLRQSGSDLDFVLVEGL